MKNILITQLYNTLKTSHPDDATEVLLEMLTSGKVPASASDPQNDDNVVLLDKHHWQSLSPELAMQIFREGNAPIKQDMRHGPVEFQMLIFVPEWSLGILPVEEPSTPTNVGGKRGRRAAIDWAIVWKGVVYLMSQQDRPTNQEELIRDISLWCDEHFGEGAAPSETALKENFSGLFRLIAEDDPKIVFPNGVKLKRQRGKSRAGKKKGRVGN